MASISSLSLEYVKIQVTAFKNAAAYNPTSDSVSLAFTLNGVNPVTGDWATGSWETWSNPTRYFARCLVGPSGTKTLAVGEYSVWVKITDSPEVPVIKAPNVLIVS